MQTTIHHIIRLVMPLLLWLAAMPLRAMDGVPFFTNFMPEAYHAHDRNFMITGDDYGRIYVANFEGLLYYDQVGWHVIHTPGIFRVTQLYKDHKGRIWVGGYNHLGYLEAGRNGDLQLKLVWSNNNYRGQVKGFMGSVYEIGERGGAQGAASSRQHGTEVKRIGESNGRMYIVTTQGRDYLQPDDLKGIEVMAYDESKERVMTYNGMPVNYTYTFADGRRLLATSGSGLIMLDAKGQEVFRLNEAVGLCHNTVNHLYVNKEGDVWGATEKGIFHVNINTPFAFFSQRMGLKGKIEYISRTSKGVYVGTLQGLYRYNGSTFDLVSGMSHACWSLTETTDGHVLASTSMGLYEINHLQARQISYGSLLSVMPLAGGRYLTCETDGIYMVAGSEHRKMCDIEKVQIMERYKDGSIWLRNIYGQVFRCTFNEDGTALLPKPIEPGGREHAFNNRLLQIGGRMIMWTAAGVYTWDDSRQAMVLDKSIRWAEDNRYPQFTHCDSSGVLWVTVNDNTNLKAYSQRRNVDDINKAMYPLRYQQIEHLEADGHRVWIGSGELLFMWDSTAHYTPATPRVMVRRITLDGDSLVWGGFSDGTRLGGNMPFSSLTFPSGTRRFTISYATLTEPTVGRVEYRYRVSGGEWSQWSTDEVTEFPNPLPGTYDFEVMARDSYGQVSEPVSITIYIDYPIWVRWYMIGLYVVLLLVGVYLFTKWRTRRLLKEKERLENIVTERTEEVMRQKEELEINAAQLQTALDDLQSAQAELIRQEKMATVGKVTQGLVDRILNPMNYINNFSHMSKGLIDEALENIEDEKDNMEADNYDDTTEVLDMVKGNLGEIEQHGINTTRILKAMEEMLREPGGQKVPTDLAALCRNCMDALQSTYASEVQACSIRLSGVADDMTLTANLDATQISKSIASMLANSLYAVRKKYGQQPYEAEIRLGLTTDEEGHNAVVTIYDNGIGIEHAILDKVFDPFFTTKTTAEAAGVGLYFSRDAVVRHGGTISIKSEAKAYTLFTITLPLN